jgi:hypothetical protein
MPGNVRRKRTLFPTCISIALLLVILKLRSMLLSVEITILTVALTEFDNTRVSAYMVVCRGHVVPALIGSVRRFNKIQTIQMIQMVRWYRRLDSVERRQQGMRNTALKSRVASLINHLKPGVFAPCKG